MEWTPLPIGVENYEEIIEKGYYYVDKTLLIKDLIDLRGKVNLFTRPRRFGKTLNMSMLRFFFEKSDDEDDLSNKYNEVTAKYLSKNGIKVLFDNESRKLHAKLCLIDDNIIYTGSHNFTYSAMKRNSESSVRIVSANEAEKVQEYFSKIQ